MLVLVVVCRWIGGELHAECLEKLEARSPNLVLTLGFTYERPPAKRSPFLLARVAVIDTRSCMMSGHCCV